MNKTYICYHRVSTKTQGVSGLGLDSQQSSTENYVKQNGGVILGSYVEVESGKNNERGKGSKNLSFGNACRGVQ